MGLPDDFHCRLKYFLLSLNDEMMDKIKDGKIKEVINSFPVDNIAQIMSNTNKTLEEKC